MAQSSFQDGKVKNDILELVRSKNETLRSKACFELKKYLESELNEQNDGMIQDFFKDIFEEIKQLANSSDISSKKGAVMSIDVMLSVEVGNKSKKLLRSKNILEPLLDKETDPNLLQLAAFVMGKLVLNAGQMGGDIVDSIVKKSTEDLLDERNERNESRKLKSVLTLREMAQCTPTFVHQHISQYFESVLKAIRDPKPQMRLAAISALRAGFAIVAKRDSEKLWYEKCLQRCVEFSPEQVASERMKPSKDDWSHGTLLLILELIRAVNIDLERQWDELLSVFDEGSSSFSTSSSKIAVNSPRKSLASSVVNKIRLSSIMSSSSTSQYSDINRGIISSMSANEQYYQVGIPKRDQHFESTACKDLVLENITRIYQLVLPHKYSRSTMISSCMVEILPRLAALDPQNFSQHYLKSSITYLTSTLKREKDRGVIYLSIGFLCKATAATVKQHLAEILEVINAGLPKDLPQKKQKAQTIEPGVFMCVSLLAQAMGPEMSLKIKDLIDPMFHAPLSPALTTAFTDISRELPALKRDIQEGLLSMLSLVLTKKSVNSTSSSKQVNLNNSFQDSSGTVHDISTIVLGLRTLGTFDFDRHSLAKLLRHCADNFLTSDSKEVRLEAVKTCSALLNMQASQTGSSGGAASQNQTVADVLTKLLTVAITDLDSDVRECVLVSLDSQRFETHLAQAENLSSLFIALGDERFEIRTKAMLMIGKLSARNPAYVMPSLRKILIQLMVVLENSGLTREKENAGVLLGLLIYAAPRIIRPYLDSVVDVLSSKLHEPGDQNSRVVANVLHALGDISEVGGRKMLPYADDLMKKVVEMLYDPCNNKRHGAIKTLGQLIFSTGLVVEPYQKFPNLMTTLLSLLISEVDISVRKEVIRVLGLLGALDPYLYNLSLGKIGGYEAAGAVVSQAQVTTNTGDGESTAADANTNEMLVTCMATSSNLDDFYPAISIASMMRIVNDSNLSLFHLDAVTSINFVFMSLGLRSVQYIPQVVPACLKVMRDNEGVREFLFKQLSTVIKIVKLHIKPYLEPIFDIIQTSWTTCQESATPVSEQVINLQTTIISLLKDMVVSIGSDFKIHLPKIIPNLLKVFILNKNEKVIHHLLEALQVFGNALDRYIHLVLPLIMRLLDQKDLSINLKRCALETITELSKSLDLTDFASSIIHPIIRIFEFSHNELGSHTMDALTAIITQLGRRARVFKPMISKAVTKQRLTQDDYSKYANLILIIEEGSSYTSAGNNTNKPPMLNRLASVSEDMTEMSQATGGRSSRTNPYDTTIRACLSGRRNMSSWTKEDWLEWLRRFDLELLKCSPNQSLRSCYYCAQNYSEVARELFNAAFVSCWTEFKDDQKRRMMSALEDVLKSTNVSEITQTILNLAEFMEHCGNKGTSLLSPAVLGEEAVKCRAYAKALHYIEEELAQYIQANSVSGGSPTPGSVVRTREKEMDLLEKLISVNNHLQQTEASRGVLLYVQRWNDDKRQSMIRVPGHFYEKLHQWDEAKKVYQEELMRERSRAREEVHVDETRVERQRRAMLGKMRCLEALGEWKIITDILNGEGVCSWKSASETLKQDMAKMAAAAAWGIGDTHSMKDYTEKIAKDSFDGLFYRAVLTILNDTSLGASVQLNIEAMEYIDKAKELMCTELSSLASESYNRAYRAMVNVQMLVELEEVIQYKMVSDQRENIKEIWWKRMNGCQKLVGDWSRLLQVHSLCLDITDDTKPWLKFADLCRKNGRMGTSREILNKLTERVKVERDIPHNVYLNVEIANLKHCWQVISRTDKSTELSLRKEEIIKLHEFVRNNRSHLAQCTSDSGQSLLTKCYLRLGSWTEITYGYTKESLSDILTHYDEAIKSDDKLSKAWHAFAYANYEAVLLHKPKNIENPSSPASNLSPSSDPQLAYRFCVDAIDGFLKSISLSQSNSLQDTLRLLTLWFDYGEEPPVYETVSKGIRSIDVENWLQVIPQLIARIDTNSASVKKLINQLLCEIGRAHPQSLIYPLTVASKSSQTQRSDAANKVLDSMRQHSPKLVEQALLVSHEFIRVAILWHELWHDGLEEASRLYFGDKDVHGMLDTLEPLHKMLEQGPQTLKEQSFEHAYGVDLREAKQWCDKYRRTGQSKDITKAWDSYYHVFRRITKQLPMLTSLEVHYVSPKLLNAKDLELAVPGTYETGKELVCIKHIHSTLQVITSKQKPRKLSIQGSNGREYQFLLKGHEDLRQDERVMQLFGLVNSLLINDADTCRRNLTIQRYSVIPLSTNSGLIGWVPHCDTLHSLIRDYRERKKILLNIEHRIMIRMAPDYDLLTLMQKVEVFEHALAHTAGDDLAKILWFKSPTSEVWFDRRTNYTRSLAVMSMVGYVLGLGDRHPSNLMLDRENGKIVHIDFGDCFEVAMSRDKFPEKIPFRLTRMLTNAMEVTGIDGNYRMTSERVMTVLRQNKDSVMAVLEAFVYDPLLNWWLSEGKSRQRLAAVVQAASEVPDGSPFSDHSDDLGSQPHSVRTSGAAGGEILNQKALDIVSRVKDKLTGKDFNKDKVEPVSKQIDLLIQQATNHSNLCQCYIGWCPFW